MLPNFRTAVGIVFVVVAALFITTFPYCSGMVAGPIDGYVRDEYSNFPIPGAEIDVEVEARQWVIAVSRAVPLARFQLVSDDIGHYRTPWHLGKPRGYLLFGRSGDASAKKKGYVRAATRFLPGWEYDGLRSVWLAHSPATVDELAYVERRALIDAITPMPKASYQTYDSEEYFAYLEARELMVQLVALRNYLHGSLHYEYANGLATTSAELLYVRKLCALVNDKYRALEAQNQEAVKAILTGEYQGTDVTTINLQIRVAYANCAENLP
jgi:hypothetical protein